MENQILEKTENKSPKRTKKSIIMIVSTVIIFMGLLLFAILVLKAPIKVTFSAPGNLGFNLPSAVVDENGKIEVPDANKLKKDHYIFLGWFRKSDGSGEPLNLENMVFEESTTVYAIWDVVEYKITYDLDGGELVDGQTNPNFYTIMHDNPTKSDNQHNNEEWHMSATELSSYIKETGLRLYEPIKNGQTFNGWQIIYNGQIQNGVTIKDIRISPLGDITLKALWS